jgi:hypothetical protein
VDLADHIELLELPGRYGDLIDERDWRGLDRIFVEDATFEVPDFTMRGLPGIRAFMDDKARRHPRTHLMTNIYVDETDSGVVMHFRLIGMLPDGRMRSVRYRDEVVKTSDGWRVAHRVVAETPYEEPAR